MQQEFETTLKNFFNQVKAHFEQQNATLNEYEQFFSKAQELFPAYAGFVQQVNDALTSINETSSQQKKSPSNTKAEINLVSKLSLQEQKKILIVDDAEINRILMGHFFKNMPVTLEFAISGEQAMEKVSNNVFDLIIMDLQMKGMSGIETIRAIRDAQPENLKKTQIVAISNQSPTDEERNQTIAAGANEYLSKSMPREAIKERVFEFLFGANQISA